MMDSFKKQEILELLAKAAYGFDEGDIPMLENVFTEKSIFVINIAGEEGEAVYKGYKAIMDLQIDALKVQTDKRRHVVTNTFFTKESDNQASTISNVLITSVEDGVIRLVTSGIYRDEVVLEEGQWKIASRYLDLDMSYA
jgi:Ring hydroxylating beta subunit.